MRVLMLTQRLPYAPNRGDRLRAYYILRELTTKADVELVSLVHDADEAGHVNDLAPWVPHVTALPVPKARNYVAGAIKIATDTPLTHSLLDAPGAIPALNDIVRQRPPDVVLAYCSSMARFALQPPLARTPLVFDFVDVDSRKWHDMAAAAAWPKSWIYRREATTLGAFEARAARHAFAATVVNEREAEVARQLAPDANIHVVLNGVDTEGFRPQGGPTAGARVVFCGVMNYAPNDLGMQWFVKSVWPLVRKARPEATLAIVGSEPTSALRSLCASEGSIEVTGRVPDVRDWLWQSAVAVAPLHLARGVQNKALEALAAGLPIVVTQAVAAGLPSVGAAVSIADDAETFTRQVLALLELSPSERRRLAETADLSALQWSSTLAPLWNLLQRATNGRHNGEQSET